MIDHYFTIAAATEGLLKEKSSKFFAYAFPVHNTVEIEQQLQILKKSHPKARHFCFGFILGADKQNFRANDDGEPSGTAGRPILGQIEKRNLTNVLVVVVRYFGGTKLGVSGLIKAYKESTELCLEKARIIDEFLTKELQIVCTYEDVGVMMSLVSDLNLIIVNVDYTEHVCIRLDVRLSEVNNTVNLIKAKYLNRNIGDITEETNIDNIEFLVD